MRKEIYDKLAAPYENDPKKARMLGLANKTITYIIYAVYPAMLIYLLITGVLWTAPNITYFLYSTFLRCIIVPAIAFFALTIFRKKVNCKRPYEVWDVKPVISRDAKGKSFPSRHAFSIFMIAMVAIYVNPILLAILLILGCILAYIRVAARVHFIKDVVAGALVGIIVGLIFFYFFPGIMPL